MPFHDLFIIQYVLCISTLFSALSPSVSTESFKIGLILLYVIPHAHHQNTTIYQIAEGDHIHPAINVQLQLALSTSSKTIFNIQIDFFVQLNWRLIVRTIWQCLFKKTVAFFPQCPSDLLRD